MSASTTITSYDDVRISCEAALPSNLDCLVAIHNAHEFAGASLDFQVEQPNYKTTVKDEKYFNGKLNCYAFTDASYVSEVKHFTVSIKDGKLSIQAPKFSDDFSGRAHIRCIGTDINLPTNFGVVKTSWGSDEKDKETPLRIRAEYKRGNISRQYADAYGGLDSDNIIYPPIRFHGWKENDDPVPYVPLSTSASMESSGTIFDAKTGFKLVLKGIQHKLQGFEITHVAGQSVGQDLGARFSSLAPFNTYKESQFSSYVNCTAEIKGTNSLTFDTALTLDQEGFRGSVTFVTRDPVNHGNWLDVVVDTTGTDLTLTCPLLTVLNPTELPTVTSMLGYVTDDYYNFSPSLLFTSAASGFTSFAIFSAVATIAAALSMF